MECEDITEKIIRAFLTVYDKIGYGFREKVYVGAVKIELDKLGLKSVRELPIKVKYDGALVGEYLADLLVEEKVLVEFKANRELTGADEMQLLNYLKATDLRVGLVLNFGEKAEFKRKMWFKGSGVLGGTF